MLDHLSADSYAEQLLAAHKAICRHAPLSVIPEARHRGARGPEKIRGARVSLGACLP